MKSRSKIHNAQLVRFLASIVTAAVLTACAAQGPPRPPRVQVPEQITNLKVIQTGRRIEIMFILPSLATDGEQLTKPIEVQIFRSVTARGEGAATQQPTLPVPAADPLAQPSAPTPDPWVHLEAADLPRFARDQRVVYSDDLSPQEFSKSLGSTLTFQIRTLTRGFRGRPILSELSKPMEMRLLDVPDHVDHLEVHSTKTDLTLTWSPPTHTVSNRPVSEIAGYRVYRTQTDHPESFKIIGEPTDTKFLDTNFQLGRTYLYRVRAVFRQGGQEAESEDATGGPFTARDIYPPAAPQELTGLYTDNAVDLIWNVSLAPDLAGYNVYRREQGKPYAKINQELIRAPIYRDTLIQLGQKYFYEATAVDASGNESKPSEEVAVETH